MRSDVDEARIARAEPEEVGAVVASVLVEREQEGVDLADASRQQGLADQIFEPFRLQPGQFARVRVVEREQRSSQRLGLRNLRRGDGMYFVIHAVSSTGLSLTRSDRGFARAKKYAGASRSREHARVLRIPVARRYAPLPSRLSDSGKPRQ